MFQSNYVIFKDSNVNFQVKLLANNNILQATNNQNIKILDLLETNKTFPFSFII